MFFHLAIKLTRNVTSPCAIPVLFSLALTSPLKPNPHWAASTPVIATETSHTLPVRVKSAITIIETIRIVLGLMAYNVSTFNGGFQRDNDNVGLTLDCQRLVSSCFSVLFYRALVLALYQRSHTFMPEKMDSTRPVPVRSTFRFWSLKNYRKTRNQR